MSRRNKYIPYTLSNYKLIADRELGVKRNLGYADEIAKKIYTNIDAYQSEIPMHTYTADQGGIFNLEFSLDGRLLVAACEERSVLLFDASNQKQIKKVSDAHSSCVNCIRFLDANIFATCSDDNTVKIWDTRRLKSAVRTLQGHSNWVKNIEYIEKDQIMITSAFDGSIYAWDLKSPTENNVLHNNIFKMNGLMRTKLTPDGSKMIICTTSGYIIIIHNLNLATLSNDVKSFRPNLYRLMQLSGQTFPTVTVFNHLFKQTRKYNRLEFVDDFPNDAEVISSLQIHPMGWCALSRNINAQENEELLQKQVGDPSANMPRPLDSDSLSHRFLQNPTAMENIYHSSTKKCTAVHDIQTRDPNEYKDAFRYVEEPEIPPDENDTADVTNRRPTDIWMGFITNAHLSAYRSQHGPNVPDTIQTTMGIINSGIIGQTVGRELRGPPEDRNRIFLNVPRLTHFVKEKSVGKGYIKELCFSSDGRIVCSPYDKGVRLLGFNEHMQELCYCVPEQPQQLYTIAEMSNYHSDVVVSCKFNPKHYQLVSGCLGGQIVWYKPIL